MMVIYVFGLCFASGFLAQAVEPVGGELRPKASLRHNAVSRLVNNNQCEVGPGATLLCVCCCPPPPRRDRKTCRVDQTLGAELHTPGVAMSTREENPWSAVRSMCPTWTCGRKACVGWPSAGHRTHHALSMILTSCSRRRSAREGGGPPRGVFVWRGRGRGDPGVRERGNPGGSSRGEDEGSQAHAVPQPFRD